MSDLTTADQQPTSGAVPARPLSFSAALGRWELSRKQTDDCRLDYLECKNFGSSESVFVAAVVYAEAANSEAEARELYEQVCDDDYHAMLLAEKDAEMAERLRVAVNEEAEVAS